MFKATVLGKSWRRLWFCIPWLQVQCSFSETSVLPSFYLSIYLIVRTVSSSPLPVFLFCFADTSSTCLTLNWNVNFYADSVTIGKWRTEWIKCSIILWKISHYFSFALHTFDKCSATKSPKRVPRLSILFWLEFCSTFHYIKIEEIWVSGWYT